MKHEIRLSGSGGQGLITAGIILARAAALFDGKNAVQTQSYGPEARGGASKAEVIISDAEINYPKVRTPDVLVALTQESLNKYIKDVKSNAVIIVDSMLVKKPPQGEFRVYTLPIIHTASDIVGSILTANIVTLGVLNKIYPLVTDDALIKTVTEMFSSKSADMNIKALKEGARL
ncbi:MAG: 2-oxoacid:acceptor oxidoreductase family protein [Deferribacteraceae bacterium]|jgi:2-oxoglutarate ferredoxin oxidoreductase subunit gamma|nr:2-oxoacid:acceptor oxidoreductase family protein [Deferribacteraceae bacterium]